MSNPQTDRLTELDAEAASLRRQLETKSSLFDVLSPPPAQPPTPAAVEDKKLKSIARAGMVACVLLFGWIMVMRASGSPSWREELTIPLMVVTFFGCSAFTAIKLLRARVVALESELQQLRAELVSRRSGSDRDR